MKWRKLSDELPTGKEYAVVLFPSQTDCCLLYIISNPDYAIAHAVKQGFTHWAEIQLAPDHDEWQKWQDDLYNEKFRN